MPRKPLHIAIMISAMLHMAVFIAWWQNQQTLVMSTTIQGSPLNISITQPAKTRDKNRKQAVKSPTPTQPTNRNEKKLALQSTENPAVSADSGEKIEDQLTPQTNQDHTQKVEEAHELALISNNMIDYLSSEFKVRFKYPHLARKRGWQGEVLIKLDINSQGKIGHIIVARSSGYKLLDLNAVETFRLIGEISPTLKRQLLEDHHLSIPVIYQLTGS